MNIINYTCGRICPLKSNLEIENAALTEENETLKFRIKCLQEQGDEMARRLAKVRQAAFGLLDQPKITGGP